MLESSEARAEALAADTVRLRRAVAMLNSMVLSGEQHSEQSKREMAEAMVPSFPKEQP